MKKKLLILSLSILSIASIAASVLFISSKEEGVESAPPQYTITLDENHRITPDTNQAENSENWKVGYVKTSEGNDIRLSYSYYMNISPVGAFATFVNEEEYLEFTMPINGLRKMEYCIDRDMQIDIGYSKGSVAKTDTLSATSGHIHTLYFDEEMSQFGGVPPCYLTFTCITTQQLTIKSMKLFYSCVAYPDPTKNMGTWESEPNEDMASGVTLTAYHAPENIPANKTIVIPELLDNTNVVTRIKDGILANVPWVEHVVIPFVGDKLLLANENDSRSFGTIFGKNALSSQYQPLVQFNGETYNTYYIPKALKTISVSQGNVYFSLDPFTQREDIPAYSFYGLGSFIDKIVLDRNIHRIGQNAFTNCSTLKNILLTEDVDYVGPNAFTGCNYLHIKAMSPSLTIAEEANPNKRPVSTGYIETRYKDGVIYDYCKSSDDSFYLDVVGLEGDTKVANIPSIVDGVNVKKIANKAFENQNQLRSLRFEDTISHVGHSVFFNCYKASVYLSFDPSETSNIFEDDWSNGLGGKIYTDYVSYHDDDVIYYELSSTKCVFDANEINNGVLNLESLSNVTFPRYAFESDLRLKEVNLPLTVKFESYSFSYCSNLEHVTYTGTSAEFMSLKEAGCISSNCFIDTKVNGVLCSDGIWVSID